MTTGEDKVVFLDIDGTILNHRNRIPDPTREAVRRLRENSVNVAIATGRAPFMFKDILKDLEIDSFVSFNGSYVVYKGEVIFDSPLAEKHLHKLENDAWSNEHPMVFLDHETGRANHRSHEFIRQSMGSLEMPHPPHDPEFHKNRHIYQALLFCEDHHEKYYYDNHLGFDYVRWHEKAIDVLPPGGSKAKGIEAMLEKLAIRPENTFAFGDGLNDVEMLRFVGTGVAMGNAAAETKQAADMETDHVDEDGLFNGLVKLGLISK
ncbi:Cof-type HAD-IIB family hydrolase [Alteribacter natronophilus]|uniref:Cof-type HAD-IIB family hydrolase n=1 Tax=Alteribacter natronophilus TaxID=2583810 RepID=UPI00110DEEA8|nr:Cof-type HAD-IIB family hydrolase [Alteribacter natronophilus]TMW73024.1 Cof-type HAD-IIB family hydrolase [Alteribacter natronophilus]